VVMSSKFSDSSVSFGMRLLHGQYWPGAHKEAYFEEMDRRALERLVAAQPHTCTTYQPGPQPVNLGLQLSAA
jgi:hypothetical protein